MPITVHFGEAGMTNTQVIIYLVLTGLVAVGTIGSVLVALFGSVLKGRWWPPMFVANLVDPEGQKTPLTDQTGTVVDHARYYHMRISNTRRSSKATDAGLYLVRIEEPGPSGQFQVSWIGDLPINCRHQSFYPLKQQLGAPIDYDLCCITKRNPTLALQPIIAGNDLPRTRTGKCDFIASFQVKSLVSKLAVQPER
jgi:hypothetical protein